MIAFNHLRVLLTAPPATASVTPHEILCGAEFGGVWIIGPAGDIDRALLKTLEL